MQIYHYIDYTVAKMGLGFCGWTLHYALEVTLE